MCICKEADRHFISSENDTTCKTLQYDASAMRAVSHTSPAVCISHRACRGLGGSACTASLRLQLLRVRLLCTQIDAASPPQRVG